MGPVISKQHREGASYIEKGIAEGATLALDGRNLGPEEPERLLPLGPPSSRT